MMQYDHRPVYTGNKKRVRRSPENLGNCGSDNYYMFESPLDVVRYRYVEGGERLPLVTDGDKEVIINPIKINRRK